MIYARSIKCKSNKYIIAQLYEKIKLQAHHLTNDSVTHLLHLLKDLGHTLTVGTPHKITVFFNRQ